MKQQRHAARQLTLARFIPALKDAFDHIDALNLGDFEGFAIVKTEEPDEVLTNRLGQCIFHTKEEAQKMIDIWAKPEDENEEEKNNRNEIRKNTTIRPVSVSSKTGLTFLDTETT